MREGLPILPDEPYSPEDRRCHMVSPDENVSYDLYKTLTDIQSSLAGIQKDIYWTNRSINEVKTSMKELREEIRADITDIRTEMHCDIEAQQKYCDDKVEDLQNLLEPRIKTCETTLGTVQMDVGALQQFKASVCGIAAVVSVLFTAVSQYVSSLIAKFF